MLFSDNVSVEEERALKESAHAKGLAVMGTGLWNKYSERSVPGLRQRGAKRQYRHRRRIRDRHSGSGSGGSSSRRRDLPCHRHRRPGSAQGDRRNHDEGCHCRAGGRPGDGCDRGGLQAAGSVCGIRAETDAARIFASLPYVLLLGEKERKVPERSVMFPVRSRQQNRRWSWRASPGHSTEKNMCSVKILRDAESAGTVRRRYACR